MRLSITYLLVSLAAGCGVGVESSPGAPITDPPITDPPITDPPITDPPITDPSAGACDAPQGPLHHYTTVAEVETLVVGQWRHCSGPTLGTADQAGIEFVDDHKFFALVDDSDGNLVRMTGFGSEGTWRADQEGDWVQLSCYTPTLGGNGGQPEFEDAPSRFAVRLDTGNAPVVYVRTGP
jgi:hypothetical protein